MRIAQIAPPWITIPPKSYGGTENVLYDLIQELRAHDHDVTLYATGDAKTSARLVSFIPRALTEEGVPWREHLQPYYHLHKAIEHCKTQRYDIVHAHLSVTSDLFLFPLLSTLRTPHVATLHSNFPFDRMSGNWIGNADRYYMDWAPDVPLVAIIMVYRYASTNPLGSHVAISSCGWDASCPKKVHTEPFKRRVVLVFLCYWPVAWIVRPKRCSTTFSKR
ncbi:MAG: glycosyltransferase family 4 protein [Chloroflexi bacterium]|nr:MAG: glycosyltransferase family 4 protein [Chloroflexota bacterium]